MQTAGLRAGSRPATLSPHLILQHHTWTIPFDTSWGDRSLDSSWPEKTGVQLDADPEKNRCPQGECMPQQRQWPVSTGFGTVWSFGSVFGVHTVDGWNPAPVEVGSLSHYLQGFSTIPGGARFQPSTVPPHVGLLFGSLGLVRVASLKLIEFWFAPVNWCSEFMVVSPLGMPCFQVQHVRDPGEGNERNIPIWIVCLSICLS